MDVTNPESHMVYFMTLITTMYMYTRDACGVVYGAKLAMPIMHLKGALRVSE